MRSYAETSKAVTSTVERQFSEEKEKEDSLTSTQDCLPRREESDYSIVSNQEAQEKASRKMNMDM